MRTRPATSGAEAAAGALALGAILAIALAGAAVGQGRRPVPDVPLTAEPGDPARGRAIVRDAAKASCLICHALPIPEEPDHGTIGPALDGVGARLTRGELRQRLVDPRRIDPDTIMPAYFSTEGLYRVDPAYRGRTIYTAQEVEDVVAWLATLSGG